MALLAASIFRPPGQPVGLRECRSRGKREAEGGALRLRYRPEAGLGSPNVPYYAEHCFIAQIETDTTMPHGYFTIEQWKRARANAAPEWVPILHLDSYQSLTKAMARLEKHGEPGLFRVLQMQR